MIVAAVIVAARSGNSLSVIGMVCKLRGVPEIQGLSAVLAYPPVNSAMFIGSRSYMFPAAVDMGAGGRISCRQSSGHEGHQQDGCEQQGNGLLH